MPRLRFALVALATLGLATPFWVMAGDSGRPVQVAALVEPGAAQGGAADRRAIEACLEERKGGRTAATCVGPVAEACVAERGSEHRRSCLARETESWSALIDETRQRLERRYGPGSARGLGLAADQQAWLADRARRCERAASRFGDDPALCTLKESGRRALHLRQVAQQAGVL